MTGLPPTFSHTDRDGADESARVLSPMSSVFRYSEEFVNDDPVSPVPASSRRRRWRVMDVTSPFIFLLSCLFLIDACNSDYAEPSAIANVCKLRKACRESRLAFQSGLIFPYTVPLSSHH